MESNNDPILKIVELDVYRLSKIDAYELAKQFRLRIPSDPNQITTQKLRQLLAFTKELCKTSQNNLELQAALAEILIEGTLSPENQVKFPKLIEFQNLLEPFYDTPENVCINRNFSASTSSQSHIYENLQSPQEKLLTERKVFVENSGHSSVESDYENPINLDKTNLELNNRAPKLNIPSVQVETNNREMAQAPAPEQIPLIKPINFSGSSYEDVGEFLTRFEIASKCNKWSESTKISLLPCYLTSYASKWFTDYSQENPGVQFDTIITNLKIAFGSPSQKIDLQETLNSRIQNTQESPLQYFYIIRNLCKKLDQNMRDEQIINYTTKGLLPSYFDALMYFDHTTLAEFQSNLAKLESKMILKKQNSRIHGNLITSEPTLLTQETVPNANTHDNKTVHFQDSTNQQLVNAITELNNKLSKLELEPHQTSVSHGRAHQSRRDASPYRKNSPSYGRDKYQYYRTNDRSTERNRYRSSSRSRDRNHRNPYFENRYRTNFRDGNRNNHVRKSENRRYNCEICAMDNHYTRECAFNVKSKNFRGRSKFQDPSEMKQDRSSQSASSKWDNNPKNV